MTLLLGCLLEGLTRSSNNLLELLHHSMFYYIMVDDERFLSIAEYIAPQARSYGPLNQSIQVMTPRYPAALSCTSSSTFETLVRFRY
jgi:hypothetical protein